LEKGKCSYLGRSHQSEKIDEKSAEAIIGFGNELPENGGGLTD
jgi:hypothetical protein